MADCIDGSSFGESFPTDCSESSSFYGYSPKTLLSTSGSYIVLIVAVVSDKTQFGAFSSCVASTYLSYSSIFN